MIERFVSNDLREIQPKSTIRIDLTSTVRSAKFPLWITRSPVVLRRVTSSWSWHISLVFIISRCLNVTQYVDLQASDAGECNALADWEFHKCESLNRVLADLSNEEAQRADVKVIFFTRHPWDGSQNNCNDAAEIPKFSARTYQQIARSGSQTGFSPEALPYEFRSWSPTSQVTSFQTLKFLYWTNRSRGNHLEPASSCEIISELMVKSTS
jgi:hypothetical protein